MPDRSHIHTPRSSADGIADWITGKIGSMKFIGLQSLLYVTWLAWNGYVTIRWLGWHAFDPYPFILLNLLLSTQAFYAAPFILMSQNRQAAKDKLRDDTEAQEVASLFAMQQDQMARLEALEKQGIAQHQAILKLLTPQAHRPDA